MTKDEFIGKDFKVVIRQPLFSHNARKIKYKHRESTQEELNKK